MDGVGVPAKAPSLSRDESPRAVTLMGDMGDRIDQKMALSSLFSLSVITWVPGVQVRSPSLPGKCLDLPRHLAGPLGKFFRKIGYIEVEDRSHFVQQPQIIVSFGSKQNWPYFQHDCFVCRECVSILFCFVYLVLLFIFDMPNSVPIIDSN